MNTLKFVALGCFMFAIWSLMADSWFDPETGITWVYTVSDGEAKLGSGLYGGTRAVPYSTAGYLIIPSRLPSTMDGHSVTSIGSYAFDGCNLLTGVTIPDSVTSIESHAFASCSSVTNVIIPNSVNYIGGWAFSGCRCLTNVTMPTGITSIAGNAFGDSGLREVIIPDGVSMIERHAFCYCDSLTNVVVGNGVKMIGQGAFVGCSKLMSINFGDNVASIGEAAFCDCNEALFDAATIPGVNLVGGWVMENATPVSETLEVLDLTGARGISDCAFSFYSKLRSVKIPDSVEHIGQGAFSSCNKLLFDTTTIPGVRLIDGWAIDYIDSLAGSLDLTGVRGIGSCAFNDCSGLTSVTIPDSVKSIDYFAFSCDNLTNITFTGNAPYVDDDAFHVNSDCVIYVPRGSTGWSVEIPGTWNGIRIEYLAEESQTHTITFSLGEHGIRTGGGGLSQIVTNGWSATAPEVVATNGWAFTGWNEIFTNVTTSLTVTAQYERLQESVDYYVSGGGYVLQHVIDIAENGSTILVGDGMYAPIDTADKTLTIRSVNGADETIINGHFDGKTWRRCALLGVMDGDGLNCNLTSYDTELQGFSLVNGDVVLQYGCGGGVAGGVLTDCIIEGCSAYLGGGTYASLLSRCVIRYCSAYDVQWWNEGMGGGSYYGMLENCLVHDCSANGDAGGVTGCNVYSSTIVDNVLSGTMGYIPTNDTSRAFWGGCSAGVNFCNVSNSVVWGNIGYGVLYDEITWNSVLDDNGDEIYVAWPNNWSYIGEDVSNDGFFADSCTYPMPQQTRYILNNITNDPQFIDAAHQNYRLQPASPCIDVAGWMARETERDLDRNPRVSGIAPDIGAYEYQYVVDLFPELSVEATHEEVSAALSGVLDADIVENITNAMQYAVYRSWALAITNDIVTAQSVKDSTRAWLSFALGADALIDKEIASEDVSIVAFTVGNGGTSMSFEVKIDGVNIGEGTVAEETLKTNLKKVLGLEGAATLDKNAFTPDGIEITFDMPKDGKAKFVATPPTGADTSFFMRVKVK